jgi:hypothetical protein
MSERKPSKIDKVKWALYRTVTEPTPEKLKRATWVIHAAVGITSLVLFAADPPNYPKLPKALGD